MRQTLKNVILTVETVVDQASLQFYEQIALALNAFFGIQC